MGSLEDGPSSRSLGDIELDRRTFNKLLVAGTVFIVTGSGVKLIKDLTSNPELTNPIPYVENEAYLEFLKRNQVSFTLHDASEDPRKTELVINNPGIFRPEINVSSRYGRLYTAHYPENLDWLSTEEREEKELETVFETFANAGITRFEFDLKDSFDINDFLTYIDFLRSLRGRGIEIIISGSSEWVPRIQDFEDEIPENTVLIPTLTHKHKVDAYKRDLENGWLNKGIGATISYRSPFRAEILRINQANGRPTKVYGIETETEASSLGVEDANIIIGTDTTQLIERANQVL